MTSEVITTTFEMSEADMKKLVRNALMVAGHEMGDTGDHWPVIKNTIRDLMNDWEALETERAVHMEMKGHLYRQLAEMEEILKTCKPDVRREVAPRIAELREVYDAFFEEPEGETLYLADPDGEVYFERSEEPIHIRRAEAILDTLEEDHE